MPVDPEIRRLAADPEVVATIKIIDRFFNNIASRYRSGISSRKSHYWQLMRRGIFCLKDVGAKLFAVRQYLRHTAPKPKRRESGGRRASAVADQTARANAKTVP
jgi:hypothetical protein